MKKSAIKFRPHHFLCAVGFEGKGYSEPFVENFAAIVQQLKSVDGDNIPIEVTEITDSICEPCPNRRATLCTDQEKIISLDNAHAAVLKLKSGDVLTWGEAKQRIIENIDQSCFDKICEPCSWKATGICETALYKLRNIY